MLTKTIDEEVYNKLMEALKSLNKQRNNELLQINQKTLFSISKLKAISSKDIFKYCQYRWKTRKFKDSPDLNTAVNDRKSCNYFSNDRIAVYTCIIGKYDELIEPLFVPNNCDFYAITDFEISKNSKWKRISYDQYLNVNGMSNATINRFYKFFPYKIFKEYRYSIYIDGNFQVISDLTEHINRISDHGVAFFLHSKRDCAYDEIKTCIDLGRGNKNKLVTYSQKLASNNFPSKYGLLACNFIARDHKKDKYKKIMEQWWIEYTKYVDRDQVSLPYILYKNDILPTELGTLGGDVHKDLSFNIVKHK